jgi:hypothetical protein
LFFVLAPALVPVFVQCLLFSSNILEGQFLCLSLSKKEKGMVATLATLGEKLEETMVNKIICSAPKHLKQIVEAITTLLDVWTLTVEGLTGRLRAVEDANEKPLTSLQQVSCTWLTPVMILHSLLAM